MSHVNRFTIYFDFLSPFSYFLFCKIEDLKKQKKPIEILWKPIVLAKIFQQWNTKAPADIAPKREFLFRQSLRYAQKNALNFMPPSPHPFNPLYALRLASSNTSLKYGQDLQEQIIAILWKQIWGKGLSPDNPDILIQWLDENNLPGKELLDQSFTQLVKNELRQNTTEAFALGIFGVPTIIAQNEHNSELFWGNDSLDDALAFLENKDLLDRNLYQLVLNNINQSTTGEVKP